jgi:cell division protein FtsB
VRFLEKYWLGAVFAVGLAILGWAVFGPQGLREVRRLHAERRELAAEIDRLRVQKRELERSALRLRENPRAIEARARRDLGMVREGETVFVLPERHDAER